MSKRTITQTAEDVEEYVEERAAKTGNFWADNQKLIMYGIFAILLVAAGWLVYKNYFVGTRQQEALQQMYQAEYMFERDSFKLALENPGGGNKGFLAIAKDYSGTDAANAASYYAGICYLNLGQFDQAIKYLEDCSPDGKVVPMMRNALLGDAYSEKKEFDKALSYYQKAAAGGGSDMLASLNLYKLGLLQLKQNKTKEAVATFKEIKSKYPNTPSGRDIDKYIVRYE
jgi:TolA-binding protein